MFQKCCKFLSIPMAVVLFISSTGIALFEHHCNTNGTSSFAVFSPVDCNDHCSHHSSCSSCCSTDKDSKCNIPEKKTNDCCNDIFHFIKADIQAISATSTSIKIEAVAVDFFQSVVSHQQTIVFSDNELKGCAYTPKPPPKTGSFIVIFFSSLKIPEFSA